MFDWWFLALLLPGMHPERYVYVDPPLVVLEEHRSKAECEASFKAPRSPFLAKQGILVCVQGPIGGHWIDLCLLDPPPFPAECAARKGGER